MKSPEENLKEWGEIQKNISERRLLEALFENTLRGSPIIDRFSTWLMAGAGATAALFISNVSDVLPHLGVSGYRVCGLLLVTSALLGLLSKFKGMLCQVNYEQAVGVKSAFEAALSDHDKEEEEIQGYAEKAGVTVSTEIDFDRVHRAFVSAFPSWSKGVLQRGYEKSKSSPGSFYADLVRGYYWQVAYAFAQTILFVAFVSVAFVYARAI